MAVRLREADSMAAVAELRQKIAELEIQVCASVCMNCTYVKFVYVGVDVCMRMIDLTIKRL